MKIDPKESGYHCGRKGRASNPSAMRQRKKGNQKKRKRGMLNNKVNHSAFPQECDALIAAKRKREEGNSITKGGEEKIWR